MDAITDNVPPQVVSTATALGLLTLVSMLYRSVSHFYKTFLRPGKDLKKLGKWAVVTGATDGIGKAYAMALAKKGLSVVLISRTESKLIDVKKEIDDKKYNGVEVKYIVCDYSKFNDAAVRKTVTDALPEEVGVLINNVGVSYRYPMYFTELADSEVQDLMTMNVETTVWMTNAVLGGMVKRKKGTIVNISSGSAMYTLPLLAEYSGAKSFIEKFSRAINSEYKSKGVTCQCQIPFYVATKLAKMRKAAMVPTPAEYVSKAMKWVGYASDSVVSPMYLHSIQGYVLDILPEFIVEKVISDMHLSTRKRGLKKDAKVAAEKESKTE